MHDTVQVRNFLGGSEKWKYGVVVKQLARTIELFGEARQPN